jgi:polar amino acid transport system substrate-binding protein
MTMPTRGLTISVIFILLFCPTIVWAETVTLVADEWPPFNATPNTSEEGVLVDVARAVFEENGIKVSYKLIPWRRAVELTRAGTHHGLIGASKTDAPDFIFPSEELSRNVISFYVRKDSLWVFHKKSDIERVSLGVIAGYDYRQWLLDYIEAHKNDPHKIQVMTGHQPLQRNILKLLNNRIDAIVDNEAVILHVARRMGVINRIKLAGHGSEIAYIYIAFSPKRADSQRYARMLSEGVVQLRRTGQLAVILSKYGLKDWK